MKEEWISLNEYARRYHMHPDQVKQLIASGDVEAKILESGYYKIHIRATGDTTREKELIEENAMLKATIQNLKSILEVV